MTAPLEINYQDRKELQVALRNFITNELKANYFCTIKPNIEMKLQASAANRSLNAPRFFKEYHYELDRVLFGKYFYKNPIDQRTFFIAIPEHPNCNIHFHLLMIVPREKQVKFELHAKSVLHKILPSASMHIAKLKTETDIRMTTFYSCKDSINLENYENFIISTQFSRLKYQRPACSFSPNT
jgi:hypothetical protein